MITDKARQPSACQAGFSLVVTLFFAGAVAAILTSLIYSTSRQSTQGKATATGWQITKIAQAARIYVRDQNAARAPGFSVTDLAPSGAGPRLVTMAQIKAAGLLPDSYAEVTPLRQNIRIIAANYPVRGNPADSGTLPSAYILIGDNEQTDSLTANLITEGARKYGLSISAPRFDSSGTNVSADCGAAGEVSFSIWDTGCLNEADFNVLAAVLPTTEQVFVAGNLLVPSWRAILHDARAVMRFPQQENNNYNQMQTDLAMGTVRRNLDGSCADFARINTGDAALSETPVCNVFDDNTAGIQNRRFDIIGMGGLDADQLIAANQSAGDVGDNADENALSDNEVLIVQGPLNVGSQERAGNIRVFDNSQAFERPVTAPAKVTFNGNEVITRRQVLMQSCNPAEEPDCTPATAFVADIDNLTTQRLNNDTFNNNLAAAGTTFELGDGVFNQSESLNAGAYNIADTVTVRQVNASETLPGRAHVVSANLLEVPAESSMATQDIFLQGDTTGVTFVATTDVVPGVAGDYGVLANSIQQSSGNHTVAGNLSVNSSTASRMNIRQRTTVDSTLNIGVPADGIIGECTGEECPVTTPPPLVLN